MTRETRAVVMTDDLMVEISTWIDGARGAVIVVEPIEAFRLAADILDRAYLALHRRRMEGEDAAGLTIEHNRNLARAVKWLRDSGAPGLAAAVERATGA